MLAFRRIKDNTFDGWRVVLPNGNFIHDGSLSALVDYTARRGYLKAGDAYRVVNNYYGSDGTNAPIRHRIYGGLIILNKSIPNPIFK